MEELVHLDQPFMQDISKMKQKPLSEKIQDIVKEIGMKEAEERQNKILEEYNLTGLNKEQIQGVAGLIRSVIKIHDKIYNDKLKEAVEKLKEELRKDCLFSNTKHFAEEKINKIFGEFK